MCILFTGHTKLKWHKSIQKKKKEVVLLISDRVEFKSKVKKRELFCQIVILYSEDITGLNTNMPNIKIYKAKTQQIIFKIAIVSGLISD